MAVNRFNILVGVGTVAVDGIDIGATEGGVTMEKAVEVYEKEVDQLLDATDLVPTKFSVTVETQLAEATLANLKLAWNEKAAITEDANKRSLPIGLRQDLPEHVLVFKGKSPEGKDRTYTVYRAIQAESSGHGLKKNEKVVFPVKFRCLPDIARPLEEQYGLVEDSKV